MAGHRSFSELRARMSPERRALNAEHTQIMLKEMRLAELREAHDVTQGQIGETLDVKQAAVSRLENRSDMRVSSVQEYVRALGGELELIAVFPEGAVRLTQFEIE